MYANSIPQVDENVKGIHLSWLGLTQWVYSPGGWSIQRRKFNPEDKPMECDGVNAEEIKQLQLDRELRLQFGTLLMQKGSWPSSIVPQNSSTNASSTIVVTTATVPNNSCDIFILELDEKVSNIQVKVNAQISFAIALREGKTVAVGGPRPQSATYDLTALYIDTVVVYAISPVLLNFCIPIVVSDEDQDKEWETVPIIANDIQIPIQKLMASLHGPDDEYAEAQSRLLSGESINKEEFYKLANTLNACITNTSTTNTNQARPIDQILLIRSDLNQGFEELIVIDPVSILLPHPKWRRILGFGYFDNDPTLTVGESYEYRVTGIFPAEDIYDKVYGFHTVPSKTALPNEFYLKDVRIRLPKPATVELSPSTDQSGLVQISRRGIYIDNLHDDEQFWLCPPLARKWSLVVDFPLPVKSVILELHEGHQLQYTAALSNVLLPPLRQVQAAENRPRLDFDSPIKHLRLEGNGFIFSIRIPSDIGDSKRLSVVLPPVKLIGTPNPEPPIAASITNLQQPQPVAEDDTPPEAMPPKHELGFEIKWRPTPSGSLSIWPSDFESAPLLDSTIYQIEHRMLNVVPTFPSELLTRLVSLTSPSHFPSTFTPLRLDPDFVNALNHTVERRWKSPLKEGADKLLARAITKGNVNALLELLLVPEGDWEPLLCEENFILGDRDDVERDTHFFPGVDLMTLFPEIIRRTSHTGLDVYWRDIFDFEEGGNIVKRPVPTPGTFHQYRIATIDSIGRRSLSWRETNVLRLEKHVPPPLPVGPDEISAEEVDLPVTIGVQARVLVPNAPDLIPEDIKKLDTHENAVVLKWGWHKQQRMQDPFAKEFRIYFADKPLDSVNGRLTNVNNISTGIYNVTLHLDRDVSAEAAKGLNLQAGYPFYIQTHTAGSIIIATLETHIPYDGNGNLAVPIMGPISLPIHLTPGLTRPQLWSARLDVVPITDQNDYETILYDLDKLKLTPDHAKDAIWVGVSTADDQQYVPDQLSPVENRPGNESAIVTVLCDGHYYGRPLFDLIPTLDPVPFEITPEPAERPIFFTLDLTPYLTGLGIEIGDLIRPERAPADAVFAAYYAAQDKRVIAKVLDKRDGSEQESEVKIPNSSDRDAIASALNGPRTDALEDRFIVFLAGSHPYRDRLFEPVTQKPIPFGPFQETLPAKSGRYVYRIRKSDAAGHISESGAMAKVVIRVPSIVKGSSPERGTSTTTLTDPPGTIRIFVVPGDELTHLLVFKQTATESIGPLEEAHLLRILNAPGLSTNRLPPDKTVLLRLPDESLLQPTIVKPLSDPDVIIDNNNGYRQINLNFGQEPAGSRIRIWACTFSRDGMPSLLGGPWSLSIPVASLPKPTLSVVRQLPNLIFTWSWPQPDHYYYNVALELSNDDGKNWTRVSPLLAETATGYIYRHPGGRLKYHLSVMSPDGRPKTHSNDIIIEEVR